MTSVRLGYRIMEVPQSGQEPATHGIEIARFHDVEKAMEEFRKEVQRRAEESPHLFLLAPNQEIVLSPDDFSAIER